MCIRDRGNRYASHFIEDNQTFVNSLEDYENVNVVNNTVERKLREAVSYTHLDVYKRQNLNSSLFLYTVIIIVFTLKFMNVGS